MDLSTTICYAFLTCHMGMLLGTTIDTGVQVNGRTAQNNGIFIGALAVDYWQRNMGSGLL